MDPNDRIHSSRGFSLFEILVAIAISSVLMTAIAYIYHGGFNAWENGYKRYILKKELSRTLESMSRNFRGASRIGEYRGIYTIEYDIAEEDTTSTYCYYLYSPDHSSDWAIETNKVYQLKEALVSQAGSGKPWWWWWEWWPFKTRKRPEIQSYGDGVVVLENIVSPRAPGSTTNLEYTIDKMIVMDFLVNNDGETVRMKSKVRPRNVP